MNDMYNISSYMIHITGCCVAVKTVPWCLESLLIQTALLFSENFKWPGSMNRSHTCCSICSFCFSCPSLHLWLIPSADGAKIGPWKLTWFLVAWFSFHSDPSTILYIFKPGLEALKFRKTFCDCCFDSSLQLENMSSVQLCSFLTIQKGN